MGQEMSEHLKPFADSLATFGAVGFDSWCEEPIMWGHRIIKHLGEDKFCQLRVAAGEDGGDVVCIEPGSWAVVLRRLTADEAIKKYGPITKLHVGPRGGFKSIRFGDRNFFSDTVRPPDEMKIDEALVERDLSKKEMREQGLI